MNNKTLLENLRVVPDFPIPGIQFQDVTTLFKNPECLKIMRDETLAQASRIPGVSPSDINVLLVLMGR